MRKERASSWSLAATRYKMNEKSVSIDRQRAEEREHTVERFHHTSLTSLRPRKRLSSIALVENKPSKTKSRAHWMQWSILAGNSLSVQKGTSYREEKRERAR